MPEYFAIRILLALVIASVLLTKQYIPDSLRKYLQFAFVQNLLPQQLFSSVYWRSIWIPIELISGLLVAAVTWDLFGKLLRPGTFAGERRGIVLCAGMIGSSLVMFSWAWEPENAFHAVLIVRQYWRIMIAAGFCVVVSWALWIRPIAMHQIHRVSGLFWGAWLICQTAMGMTGAGCILHDFWREVCDTAMLIQIGIAWNLRQTLIASRKC